MSKQIRLSQAVALDTNERTRVATGLTELHRRTSKADLFTGQSRVFHASVDGEEKPPESKKVQYTASQGFSELRGLMTPWFDAVLTKDTGNTKVLASVEVEGFKLTDVPVPTLLWMEKQVEDMRKFVESMPILDPAYEWEWDANQGIFRSAETRTISTKKVQEAIVLYPATAEHPAQTQMVQVDRPVGSWATTAMSGALSGDKKRDILTRINTLARAIKSAREEANSAKIDARELGEAFFDYIFGA